ncbi:MAG TPA: flagellar export chaperone FliS [Bryobacteraceae bacterium]|nr:flagellar export chaperone FliS [Bryobacteraceae bacterium]
MTESNPYHAYAEGSVLSDQPLRLVVTLHQGAMDATRQALQCLEARDIWGRGKAINKGIAILSELLSSLDEEKGAEIAQNLKRLYLYMQRRLIEAHSRQAAPPLLEVEKLIGTLHEGWCEAAEGSARELADTSSTASSSVNRPEEARPYADYASGDVEAPASPVFSF